MHVKCKLHTLIPRQGAGNKILLVYLNKPLFKYKSLPVKYILRNVATSFSSKMNKMPDFK